MLSSELNDDAERRLKAASVAFGLRTGSEELFNTDGPAIANTISSVSNKLST